MRAPFSCAASRVIMLMMVLATEASGQCFTQSGDNAILRTLDGAPAYIESPVFLNSPKGFRLFGVPALRWWKPDTFFPVIDTAHVDSAALSTQVGTLLANAGAEYSVQNRALRLIRTPKAAARLARPLAAMNSVGRVSVVFSSHDDTVKEGQPRESLWYYELSDTSWSGGAQISVPGTLRWTRESAVVVTAGERTFAFATAVETGKGGSIAIASFQDGQWRFRSIPVRGLPYYLTAATVSPDTALIVFGATDVRAGVSNGSHLFQMRVSLRDGVSSPPERIQWSGLNGVVRPSLLQRERRGKEPAGLVLTWGVDVGGATDADSLFASVSLDHGRTWSVQAAAKARKPLTHLTSIIFRDRGVGILGIEEDRTPTGERKARLYTVRGPLVAGASLPFVPRGVLDLTGASGRDDTLVVVWADTKATKPGSGERAPLSGLVMAKLRCLLNG